MGEPEKAKTGSGETKTLEATSMSNDGQPVQATTEVRLGKVEDQFGKANAGTERLETGIGKTEVETTWVRKAMRPLPLSNSGGIVNKLAPMQSSLPVT